MRNFLKAFTSSVLMTALYFFIGFILVSILYSTVELIGMAPTTKELFYYNYSDIFDCVITVVGVALIAFAYRKKIHIGRNMFSLKDIKLTMLALSILIGVVLPVIVSNLMNSHKNAFPKFDSSVIVIPKLSDFTITIIIIICLELFFRGMVLELIKEKIKLIGFIITSSILGAIIHYSSMNGSFFCSELLTGAIVGFMYYYTKNLWYPIVTRIVINSIYMFNLADYKYIYNYAAVSISIVLLIISIIFFYKVARQHLNEKIDINKITS